MNKIKSFLLRILIVVFLGLFIYSAYQIIKYYLDNQSINNQINNINKITELKEVDNTNDQVIENNEEISSSNPYWDYINMNLINIDFNNLKNINNDIKGWIQVNGTNINYPFVQASDNKYYLNHSLDKSSNSAGWVFLDYRNDLSNLDDKNTIIYAHGRLDKTMFGTLKDILTKKWLNNSDNHIVKLSNEYENTLWQVFSIYRIPTTSDYIRNYFKDDDDYKDFINTIVNRSSYHFNTTVSTSDRILTLSTCYNDTDKVVLHAKLIKRQIKNT